MKLEHRLSPSFSSFVPDEDQGYFFIAAAAPDAASQSVVSRLTGEAEKIVLADPAVQDVATVNGYSLIDGQFQNNAAVLFGSFKPFEERKDPSLLSFAALPRLNAAFAKLRDGFVFALNPPSIPGMGTTGGFEFYVQNHIGGPPAILQEKLQAFLAKAQAMVDKHTVRTVTEQNIPVDGNLDLVGHV